MTNRGGDEAHQSHSVVMLPETLHYSSIVSATSGVRNQKQFGIYKTKKVNGFLCHFCIFKSHLDVCVCVYLKETQLSCTANDKGTQIDCELGNPLHRDAEVSRFLRVCLCHCLR